MKKSGMVIAIFILMLLLSISLIPKNVSAAGSQNMTVTLRIEGISDNIFYGELEVPYGDELTAAEVIMYADDMNASLAVNGADAGFITDINGEASGTFGGWDGWLFMVNGVSPSEGADVFLMSEGDVLLVYYGDPFGAGMQFPQADLSSLSNGTIRFTSTDTVYDKDYNPTVSVNPVVGAAVTWYTGSTASSFTTDSNGEIVIPENLRTPGTHRMQISKTGTVSSGSLYLPMVLRFAPDHEVKILSASSGNNPQTGDTSAVIFTVSSLALLIAVSAYARKRRKQLNE